MAEKIAYTNAGNVEYDIEDAKVGIDDLIEQFDYKPATAVESGISCFVAWYRDYFKV